METKQTESRAEKGNASVKLVARMVLILLPALICFAGWLLPELPWDAWQWIIGIGAAIEIFALCFLFDKFAFSSAILLPVLTAVSLLLLILLTKNYRIIFGVHATLTLFMHGYAFYRGYGVGKGRVARAHVIECAVTLAVLIVSYIVV